MRLPRRTIIFRLRASVGSQSPQRHLEDGSVYRPLWPTVMDSNPRCRQLSITLTPTLTPALLVIPGHRAPSCGLMLGVPRRHLR